MNSSIRHARLPLEILHLLCTPHDKDNSLPKPRGPSPGCEGVCWALIGGLCLKTTITGEPQHHTYACSVSLIIQTLRSKAPPPLTRQNESKESRWTEAWFLQAGSAPSFAGRALPPATGGMVSCTPGMEVLVFMYTLWIVISITSRLHNKRTFSLSLSAWSLFCTSVFCWGGQRKVLRLDPALGWNPPAGWNGRPLALTTTGLSLSLSCLSFSPFFALPWPCPLSTATIQWDPSSCPLRWSFYYGIHQYTGPPIPSAISRPRVGGLREFIRIWHSFLGLPLQARSFPQNSS